MYDARESGISDGAGAEASGLLSLGTPPRLDQEVPPAMRALCIRRGRYGPPDESIDLETLPSPRLDPLTGDRLVVALLATGPNFNTNFAALGLPVPVFGRADPAREHIPGSDGVGLVVDAGAAVDGPGVGRAVILDSWDDGAIRGYETHDGFNAQFTTLAPEQALPIPAALAGWPPERLGALLLTYGTAYRAIVERLAVGPDDSVLVMGGGKGTSFAACQIARDLGARVILVGSNVALMESIVGRGFADAWMDRRNVPEDCYGVLAANEDPEEWARRTEAFRGAVRDANGGRLATKVFDHTGGRNFPLLVSCLEPGGSLAFFGATGSGVKGEYRQTFFYEDRRFVMDARWVWMRQKQVLFRSASPDAVLAEIGLPPGRRALVWGADEAALEFVAALRRRAADVAVFFSGSRERDRTGALQALGVSADRLIDVDGLELPADMPDPLTDEGEPNPRYAPEFLRPAQALGRRLWKLWGSRVSPDVVVEQSGRSTLHLSTFLAKNFDEGDVMATGVVVVPGTYDLSLRGSHMYGRGQAREVVRLLAEGRLAVEPGDLEVVRLGELPQVQQKMLDGTMTKSKGVALVQGDVAGRPIAEYEDAYLGARLRRSDPRADRFLDVWVLDGVALVRINRPGALNALSAELLGQLAELAFSVESQGGIDGVGVRGLVLTGSGRAFMAGADVGGFVGGSAEEIASLAREVNRVYRSLETLPVPVVALVDGFAFGGGNELAMSAHYRLATPRALFGQPEVKLGIFPGYGGMQRLPRLVGPRAALALAANGEPISAQNAFALGLVDAVVGPATGLRSAFEKARDARPHLRDWDDLGEGFERGLDELDREGEVQALAAASPPDEAGAGDVRAARRAAAARAYEAMAFGLRRGFDAGLENDARLFGETVASPGGRHWIARFLDKDPAQAVELALVPPDWARAGHRP